MSDTGSTSNLSAHTPPRFTRNLTPDRLFPSSPSTPPRAYSRFSPTFNPPLTPPRTTLRGPSELGTPKRRGDGSMDDARGGPNVAGPSRPRHNLAIPRPPRTGRHVERPIDLTLDESSDEDDMIVTGANVVRPVLPRPQVVQRPIAPANAGPRRMRAQYDDEEFQDEFEALDRAMQRHGRDVNAILAAEGERGREASPPAPPPIRPRIGLGGAVMRAGDRQINFDAQRNRRQVAAPLARYSPEFRSPSPRRRYPPPRRAAYQPSPPPPEPDRRDEYGWMLRQRLIDHTGLGRLEGMIFGARGVGLNDARAAQVAAAMGLHIGGAPGGMNVEEKTASVPAPVYPDPPEGFTNSFDLETLPGPIIVDDEGKVDKPPRFFACASCEDPLLISGAYDSPADRVWALRCGHLVDQKCLDRSSIPTTPEQIRRITNFTAGGLPILGEEVPKKRRKTTKKNSKPSIFLWYCPVETCRREHCSEKKPGEEFWVQTEDAGALAAFM